MYICITSLASVAITEWQIRAFIISKFFFLIENYKAAVCNSVGLFHDIQPYTFLQISIGHTLTRWNIEAHFLFHYLVPTHENLEGVR